MLQGLRSGSRNLATKIVLFILMGLLIVSFAFWGIGDVFRNFGTASVARVGSTDISSELYRRAFTERVQQIGRQLNVALNAEAARGYGIDRLVLGELVSQAALDEKARQFGLGVTDQMIAERVRAYPAFRGPDGNFNSMHYLNVLRDNNYTEATFLAAQRREIVREQLLSALGTNNPPPASLVNAIWRFNVEQRTVEMIRLTRAQAGTIAAPTEDDLKTYYEANKKTLRTKEFRKLRVLQLSPTPYLAAITISDDESRKEYENQKERLTQPEKRLIEQVNFRSLDAAKAAAERVKKGEKLEAIAKELKLEIVSLNLVTKTEILDPAVADAAFALSANQTSEPVSSRFGPVILRVAKIEAIRTPSFEEAKDQIANNLKLQRAYEQTRKIHDQVEDERGGGSTLAEISEKLKLKLTDVEVDASGRKPDGNPVIDIPSFETILKTAFATPKGVEIDPIEQRDTRSTIWYEVADIVPERERTFEEAKADVEARWKDEQTTKKLLETALEMQKKLDAGAPFAEVAPGVRVEKLDNIRRNAQVPGVNANLIAQIFVTPQGKSGVGNPPDTVDKIVFRVVTVGVPPGEPPAEVTQQIQRAITNELQDQFVQRLQDELGVRVNENAVRQVTGDTARN
ncbi:MAG TPA: SurA N-terminal domain-containing protein [Xanthobacteraceae bacterium]|nr:SurA N-terminal domain-containing protein [Xanthobacteraceae bacterium]